MKCVSCGAENSSDSISFNCEYCGAQNVTQSYFDDKSQDSIDESKNLSPIKKEGLKAYKLRDYENSINSLTEYLKEDDSDSEAWLFLALSEAKTIKASSFLKDFRSISYALEKAKEHSDDQDLFNNSEIKLSSDLIINSSEASHTYFRNSEKRFESFGGGLKEADTSIEVLEVALGFPNHGSQARIEALCYGIKICSIYNHRFNGESDFKDRAKGLAAQLEDLYEQDSLKDKIGEAIDSYFSRDEKKFLKGISTHIFPSKEKKKAYKSKLKDEEEPSPFKSFLIVTIVVVFLLLLFL